MRSNIIKKGTADEVRCVVTELRLSETFMGVPQLSVKVVSPVTVDIEIGDYIVYDYNGVTYTLREMPGREKHARPSTYGGAFVYNLVFHGPEWDLRNAPFLDLVLYDNGQHFTSMPDVTTYEDVYGIAARVQANMDNMYPGKWEIRVVSGLSAYSTLAKRLSETQDFSLSDGKCLDALSQVYSQWGVSFVYSYESGKHVITIGGAETQENTTGLFMYGRGNGLKVIKSSVQNASEIATRYYVYGGTQNMRPRYYNAQLYTPELSSQNTGADSSAIGELLLPMSVIGGSMYIPNLMIPISKWGKTKWYAWYNADSGFVFTEIRNPQQGQSYIFKNPNIGSFLGVVSGRGSDYVQYEGVNYSWVAEINFPDIRKAYIDAPQSYIDKYGIRPATLRFDGSGEREDIHPSIKGLTIGDIRTGLGSGAEYYPSTSVYTDPDERVDKVLSCDNPADDGLNTEDGNKYVAEDSVINNSIIREYEMKVRDDGWRGYMKDKTYLSGNYGEITVTRKGYLDFRLPLVATVENGEQYNITAGVEVFKKDPSGHNSLIIQYTTTNQPIKGNPEENIYFGTSIRDNKISVDEGDTLSISLWFQAVTDNVLLNTIKWTIPEFTMVWRYELSLDSYFYIKLKQIGFDISQISTNDGEYPVISITSGQCGGYEFEIHDATYSASDDSWMLRCARVQDGTLGQWFPNNVFKIEPEDLFVLLNIALPRVYITSNEQHLYDTALAERLYEERPLLEPEIDNKVMAESPQVLHAGMWFSVKDTDLGLVGTDGDSYLILIDSVEVTDKPDAIRSFKVTLRNNKEDNVFTLMQKQIVRTSSSIRTERRNQTKTSVTKAPESNSSEGSVNSADFVTLSTEQTITGKKTFAKDVVFGADGGRMFIPSATPGTYDLFVDSGMAIEGDAPAPGGGGLDEDELWRVLQDAGTETISKNHLPSDTLYSDDLNGYARTEDIPSLDGYATQTWVQGQGYITSASLDPYAKTEDIQKWVDDSFVRTSELPSLDGYLEWGSVTSLGQYVSVTDGNGVSHNLSLSTHTHKVGDITDFPQTWEWSKISGAPTTLSGYGITDAYTKSQSDGKYVGLSNVQTITGDKTFSGDVVFGADGGRMFIPSATPGTYDLFVDSGMAIEGEAPSGGDYLLNDLHDLDENATSANIDAAIGGYENLRQAIRSGKVIVDNRTMDYDYDRLVAVEAMDGGSENFISLTFHSSMYKTRRYVISRDGSGNLSLTVTDSGSFLSDSHSYSQLDTENQTVLGAINEVADKVSDALPYWCGRVLSTGQLTKMSGSGNISVRRTAAGVYSVQGATPGMSVTVTPLNFTNSLVTLEPLTAAILQNSSNGLITIHIFNSSGTRVNSAFSLLII